MIRYSAGTEGQSISVNGEQYGFLCPKRRTGIHGQKLVPIHVVVGRNTINICYNEGDFSGINLDCICIE